MLTWLWERFVPPPRWGHPLSPPFVFSKFDCPAEKPPGTTPCLLGLAKGNGTKLWETTGRSGPVSKSRTPEVNQQERHLLVFK